MVQEPSPVMFDHLYSLSDRREYDELIRHIRDHENEEVRYGAAGVLSESVDGFREEITPQTRKALVESVLNEPSDAVRANIVRTLLHIDESIIDNIITRLEVAPESTPTEMPYPRILTNWHGTEWPELRYLAVAGFGRSNSQSAAEKLRATIQEEMDMRVLRRAIEEGGKVGDETFVEPIQTYLRADNEKLYQSANADQLTQTKQAAVEALVKIGTDAAYEALVTASRGTDEELRGCVISEIGKFGAENTVDLIVDELNNDADDALRAEAAEGLITTFTESEFDEGHAVRQQAIEQIGDDVATDVSDEFASIVTESPRKPEQRNAAWLLGQIEGDAEDTIDGLLAGLEDDDEYLRIIAAAGLTTFDPAVVADKLVEFRDSVDDTSEAHVLASSILSTMQDTSDEIS